MKSHNLGFPRIGAKRELKKATEAYWSKKISLDELKEVGRTIRRENWLFQKEAGLDFIPVNDFSFYDQVLDLSLTIGNIPEQYQEIKNDATKSKLDVYFAIARGLQDENYDVKAAEMTKWFDTNYHYIVPEFYQGQRFEFYSSKILEETKEALFLGIQAKPVLISPVTYLHLGKEKEDGFDKFSLLAEIVKVYKEVIHHLVALGIDTLQIDEPILALDITEAERKAIESFYVALSNEFPTLNVVLTTYFDALEENIEIVKDLPIQTLHVDLVRAPQQLNSVLKAIENTKLNVSLGLVDGRNIWKNNFKKTLRAVELAVQVLGKERVWIGASCSLLHSPVDLASETKLDQDIQQWLAFAKQKVHEIACLKRLALDPSVEDIQALETNTIAALDRQNSEKIHKLDVKARVADLTEKDAQRTSEFIIRQQTQKAILGLPLFPTTTIGSFPQTPEVRRFRSQFKKGQISLAEYEEFIARETQNTIEFQEEVGLDVLVHGEFERNDMVEYFGEQLEGFCFTEFGWVQSYGSRCVKPPIIYGDIERLAPMTVAWTKYAQSLTPKPVKGMLTGPVTILQWSFVRNDQPREVTCNQIALAIRDEVNDLELAGIQVIQIDEPAIREGLPLRKEDWKNYLNWSVNAFKISSCGVSDATQIHTHMCYSEFNDIITDIAAMDADVITIECSRSQMELLDAFRDFDYPNEIGPGVYDIHSPRVPSVDEINSLLDKATNYIPTKNLWVNPDCGLKTRKWPETKKALEIMVKSAQKQRESFTELVS